MTLFVCSSIYQLMNAVLIRLDSNSETADIVFIKSLEHIIDVKKLRELHVFREIYIWKGNVEKLQQEAGSHSDYVKHMFSKIPLYAFPQKLARDLPNRDENYKHIYVPYGDYPSQIIYFYFKKKNEADLYLYEDGSYTYECLATTPSIFRRIYSQLFFRGMFFSYCKKVYVHKIEEVRIGKRNDVQISPIKQNTEQIRKIFQFIALESEEQTFVIKERIIMFDQNLEYENILWLQEKIACDLTLQFGRENVCVKLHPGTKVIRYYKDIKINACKMPFELFMNSSITNESILISIFSTACFNPKWIYGLEPYIILTYKIVKFDSVDYFDTQYYEVIERLRNSYSREEKIFIPETIEEMVLFIKKIMSGE